MVWALVVGDSAVLVAVVPAEVVHLEVGESLL